MTKTAKPASEHQECGCQLTPLEISLCREIFTALLESGRAPTLREASLSLGRPSADIASILDHLQKKDLLLRGKETHEIASIYPISLTPTDHQVVLRDGRRLFAMCAVDALGIPNMFDRNVTIDSQCEWCTERITIEIEGGEIVSTSHPKTFIWSPGQRGFPAAETCCPLVNFFCSNEHLEAWKGENSSLAERGHSTPLDQAYPRIQRCWKSYGETIGLR